MEILKTVLESSYKKTTHTFFISTFFVLCLCLSNQWKCPKMPKLVYIIVKCQKSPHLFLLFQAWNMLSNVRVYICQGEARLCIWCDSLFHVFNVYVPSNSEDLISDSNNCIVYVYKRRAKVARVWFWHIQVIIVKLWLYIYLCTFNCILQETAKSFRRRRYQLICSPADPSREPDSR